VVSVATHSWLVVALMRVVFGDLLVLVWRGARVG
jgi:hypothetical protein